MHKSLEGQLLVASPGHDELRHRRRVVLVVSHSAEGALGVVLNHPGNARFEQAWRQSHQEASQRVESVRVGGPVLGSIMTVARPMTASLVRAGAPVSVDLIVGHASWSAGQLDEQCAAGLWMTTPARAEHLLIDPDYVWREAVRSVGHDVLRCAPQVRHLLEDPSVN